MRDKYELGKDEEEFYDECDKFRRGIRGIFKFLKKQGILLLISALILVIVAYFGKYEMAKVMYIGGMVSMALGMLQFAAMGASMNKNHYDVALGYREPTNNRGFSIDSQFKKRLIQLIVLAINGLILMGISQLIKMF